MPLSKSEARLECLRLAVRPGLGMDSILDTAEEYFRFIVQYTDDAAVAIEDEPKSAKAKAK